MRTLVVGAGSIGTRHLHNLRALEVSPLAVVEVDAPRRQELERTGVECFATLEQGLAWKPDAVFLTTPTQFHVEQALQAARAGCHLFVEKPLSHSVAGCQELCESVARRVLVSMVGCNMRFHPGPAAIKAHLEKQTIGKPLAARLQCGSYLPAWRPAQDYRQSYSASPEHGGIILDGIHEIDLALWYFGPAVVTGSAVLDAGSLGLRTDGLAEILLQHQAGLVSNVHLNFIQRDYRRTCQVIGTEGTLYWDFETHRVDIFGTDGKLRESQAGPANWQLNDMYLEEVRHFLDCVRMRRATVNPLAAALNTLEVALTVGLTSRAQTQGRLNTCPP
jgi:predicted dehydrogenase